jgi:hypothetical protein
MTDTPQDPIAAARQDHRTYMQQYRAAGRDLSTKAHNRAKLTALTWVRRTHPDVWQQALDDAWKDIRADEVPGTRGDAGGGTSPSPV